MTHEITTLCKNKWTAKLRSQEQLSFSCFHAMQNNPNFDVLARKEKTTCRINHLFVLRRYKPNGWCNWQSNGVYILAKAPWFPRFFTAGLKLCILMYTTYCMCLSTREFQWVSTWWRASLCLPCHVLPIPPGWCEVDTLGPRRRATMRHWDPPDYHQGILRRAGGVHWNEITVQKHRKPMVEDKMEATNPKAHTSFKPYIGRNTLLEVLLGWHSGFHTLGTTQLVRVSWCENMRVGLFVR